jgi:hypothetical protein
MGTDENAHHNHHKHASTPASHKRLNGGPTQAATVPQLPTATNCHTLNRNVHFTL